MGSVRVSGAWVRARPPFGGRGLGNADAAARIGRWPGLARPRRRGECFGLPAFAPDHSVNVVTRNADVAQEPLIERLELLFGAAAGGVVDQAPYDPAGKYRHLAEQRGLASAAAVVSALALVMVELLQNSTDLVGAIPAFCPLVRPVCFAVHNLYGRKGRAFQRETAQLNHA